MLRLKYSVKPALDLPAYIKRTYMLVSRGQTAFFRFYFFPPPQIKTEKSGLATRDYVYATDLRAGGVRLRFHLDPRLDL